ncbi:rCG60758 [Rattus norvegicus]|uniref:RCG60758 n=1 Tax=Rattus norvegicus TaxID=10116 RepID=A6JKT4_RAT|nr:rCG60758 [Rattus norvegicus]
MKDRTVLTRYLEYITATHQGLCGMCTQATEECQEFEANPGYIVGHRFNRGDFKKRN